MPSDTIIDLSDYFKSLSPDAGSNPQEVAPAYLRHGPITSEVDLRERARSFLSEYYLPRNKRS